METILIINTIVLIILCFKVNIEKKKYSLFIEENIKFIIDKATQSNFSKVVELGLSKQIKELYLDFIQNPNDWILGEHTLFCDKNKVEIWASNTWENRRIYKKNGKDYKEDPPTYADKLLMESMIVFKKKQQEAYKELKSYKI